MTWEKAENQKSNRKNAWVIVPLKAGNGEQLNHAWAVPNEAGKQANDKRGIAMHTYQAFFKNEQGQMQTYIIKVLPSLDNLRKYRGKAKLSQFDGLVLCFTENGKFLEGVKYDNGRPTESTTALSEVDAKKSSPSGRLAGCTTYSVSVSWRICVEYQGVDVCVSGTDTYSSTYCSGPFADIASDAPVNPDGSTGGGGGSEPDNETLDFLENAITFGPDRPINDVRKYLECFDNNAYDRYRITVYVDQPKPNTPDYFSQSAIGGHKVGHTYIGLTQEGPYNRYVNRVLGWYPASSANPFNKEDQGLLGNDSNYSAGYDVSVTFSVNWSQFQNVMSYIQNNSSGNYNIDTFNCMDFGLQALRAANINLPDNNTSWPRGGGSSPGPLGEALRNMSLPAGATRQTSFGLPTPNSADCR